MSLQVSVTSGIFSVIEEDGGLGEGFEEVGAGGGVEVGAEADCVGVEALEEGGEVAAVAVADEDVGGYAVDGYGRGGCRGGEYYEAAIAVTDDVGGAGVYDVQCIDATDGHIGCEVAAVVLFELTRWVGAGVSEDSERRALLHGDGGGRRAA